MYKNKLPDFNKSFYYKNVSKNEIYTLAISNFIKKKIYFLFLVLRKNYVILCS